MASAYETEGQIVDPESDTMNDPMLESQDSIESYVLWKAQEWTDFIEANFYSQWDEYYRLWRGLWASEDSTRGTERSRIVTPALQQAVESSVAEIEESTFGLGKLFDIRDDSADQDEMDVALLRTKLDEDLRKQRVRQACSEVLINAAVYGTGAAEIVLEEVNEMVPATESAMDGQVQMVGVNIQKRNVVKMKPIQMKNFLIDPVATCVNSAHGVATDEFVPAHYVKELQEKGVYRDVFVGVAAQDQDIEPNNELDTVPYMDKVRLLKYYGLVPRHLLDKAQGLGAHPHDDISSPEEVVTELFPEDAQDDSYWVEAIVVIANEGVLLKVEENPYMMQDRPIVAFQWDVVPGLFWGRGVCEKGYNSQKALDAEIRARIDALALTIHPMLAMDATRIPRGHKPVVRPGKMILTNGNPNEVLQSFNFGQVDQITFSQAAELQKMVQQSTGAMDGAEFAGGMGSNNKTGAVSMALGTVIKRQKRTVLNFQEGFWIPFVEKAAWRYMQFDPENYPVKDYKFLVESTLGTMAREYQVSQLVQLMQTASPESPIYPALVQAVVDNMDVENREELNAALKKAAQPDPEEQQRQQQMEQMQLDMQIRQGEAQIAVFEAQAAESNARAEKYKVEAELEPRKIENDRIDAVADIRDGVTAEQFNRRLKVAETKLRERELNIKEKDIDLRRKNEKEAQNMINSSE
jgi:hypothetical protein